MSSNNDEQNEVQNGESSIHNLFIHDDQAKVYEAAKPVLRRKHLSLYINQNYSSAQAALDTEPAKSDPNTPFSLETISIQALNFLYQSTMGAHFLVVEEMIRRKIIEEPEIPIKSGLRDGSKNHQEIKTKQEKGNQMETSQQISTEQVTELDRLKHDLRSPLTSLISLTNKISVNEYGDTILSLGPLDANSFVRSVQNIRKMICPESSRLQPIDEKLKTQNDEAESKKLKLMRNLFPEVQQAALDCERAWWTDIPHLLVDMRVECGFTLRGTYDRNDLYRIVTNILNNAGEAGATDVIMTVYPDSIIFLDNGKGMPDEVLEKLGRERVTYGKENRTIPGTGTGILSCAQILQKHGGSISYRRVVQDGKTMTEVFINL